MKILKIVVIVILAIILLAVAIAYLLPRNIKVERSTIISASPEVVFRQVDILKNWEQWSPWHEIDPNMTIVYEGPEMGKGASYAWSSTNPQAGNGKLVIIESISYSLIKTEIDFMERGTATAQYLFDPVEGGTLMTWSMDTDMGNNPVARYFGLFMDKLLGRDFEKGLANLKAVVNSLPEIQPE